MFTCNCTRNIFWDHAVKNNEEMSRKSEIYQGKEVYTTPGCFVLCVRNVQYGSTVANAHSAQFTDNTCIVY